MHISAFKRQQFRWAKGSIQTARKLLPDLWRSTQPLHIKLEGTIHLTHYLVHFLILLNLLLTLPVLYLNSRFYWTVHIFTTAAIGPLLMYWISMRRGGQSIRGSLTHLVVLLFMGMGLSVNNTRAAIEAGLGVKTSFLRTPKFNITGGQDAQGKRDYLLHARPQYLAGSGFSPLCTIPAGLCRHNRRVWTGFVVGSVRRRFFVYRLSGLDSIQKSPRKTTP